MTRQTIQEIRLELNAPLLISSADRRCLLGGQLRLLHRRFARGQKITRSDLLRTAWLADDARDPEPGRGF